MVFLLQQPERTRTNSMRTTLAHAKGRKSFQKPASSFFLPGMWLRNDIGNGKQCIRLNLSDSEGSNRDSTDPPSLWEEWKSPLHTQLWPRTEWQRTGLMSSSPVCTQTPLAASAHLSRSFSLRKQSLSCSENSLPYLWLQLPTKPQGETLPKKAMTA